MGPQAPWALPGLESPYLISPKTCIFPFSHLRSWTCTLHWMLMKLLHVCVCRAGCCCWWHAWATEGSRCCTSGDHCVRVTRVHVCVSFRTWKGKRYSGWLVPRGKGTTTFPLTLWTCSKTRHAEFSQVKSIFLTRHLASFLHCLNFCFFGGCENWSSGWLAGAAVAPPSSEGLFPPSFLSPSLHSFFVFVFLNFKNASCRKWINKSIRKETVQFSCQGLITVGIHCISLGSCK